MSDNFTAFAGQRLVAHGSLAEVARHAKVEADAGAARLVIFEDASGRLVELDWRGSVQDVLARFPQPQTEMAAPARAGRGRPKLGVVAREVTLLPRHWDWLAGQPGGASAALRRLVEEARRARGGADRARHAQQALYCVMSVLAGDLPGFEEATRALYAHDDARLEAIIAGWPEAVADYLRHLAAAEREARAAA